MRVHEASRHELSMAGFPLARERPVARWPQRDGVVGRRRVRRRRGGGFGVGEYGGEVGGCLSGNAWARWGHEPLGRESNSGSQRTPQLSLTHPSSSLSACPLRTCPPSRSSLTANRLIASALFGGRGGGTGARGGRRTGGDDDQRETRGTRDPDPRGVTWRGVRRGGRGGSGR